MTAKKHDDKNWNFHSFNSSMGQEGACMHLNVPAKHGLKKVTLRAHDSITLDMKINYCDSLDRL